MKRVNGLTRLYALGNEEQLPHWYRTPTIVCVSREIYELNPSISELTWPHPLHMSWWSSPRAGESLGPDPTTVRAYEDTTELGFECGTDKPTLAASPPVQRWMALRLAIWSWNGVVSVRLVHNNKTSLCRFEWIGNLQSNGFSHSKYNRVATVFTLINICEEVCPPSAESKFPGRPADSQFAQMSTESQIAQWKRAPTMSSRQLYDTLSGTRTGPIAHCGLLSTPDTWMSESWEVTYVW